MEAREQVARKGILDRLIQMRVVEAKLFDIVTVYRSLLPTEKNRRLPLIYRALAVAFMTYALYLLFSFFVQGPMMLFYRFRLIFDGRFVRNPSILLGLALPAAVILLGLWLPPLLVRRSFYGWLVLLLLTVVSLPVFVGMIGLDRAALLVIPLLIIWTPLTIRVCLSRKRFRKPGELLDEDEALGRVKVPNGVAAGIVLAAFLILAILTVPFIFGSLIAPLF